MSGIILRMVDVCLKILSQITEMEFTAGDINTFLTRLP